MDQVYNSIRKIAKPVFVALTFCFPLSPPPCVCFFGLDPGLFLRVLGWHQACMLDEGRDPLEVFPQAVHLPKSHKHQPVLPHHHPSSGTWTHKHKYPVKRHKLISSDHFSLLCCSCTSSQSQMWMARWTASVSGCLHLPMAWLSALLLWKVST